VRRWLTELAAEGLVKKSGQKRGTRYIAVDQEVEVSATQKTTFIFSQESQSAITKIQRPIFERAPVTYNHNWFENYQVNKTQYLSDKIKSQLFHSGKKRKDHEPAGTYARHIYNRLLIDLSYNSSRLEGNTYSLSDTKRLLIEGASAEGKLDEETVMILNHKEAIRHLVDSSKRIQIDYNEICTLHFLLHYDTLHYTTLHYTTRNCNKLNYTKLHYTTLHYNTLN